MISVFIVTFYFFQGISKLLLGRSVLKHKINDQDYFDTSCPYICKGGEINSAMKKLSTEKGKTCIYILLLLIFFFFLTHRLSREKVFQDNRVHH